MNEHGIILNGKDAAGITVSKMTINGMPLDRYNQCMEASDKDFFYLILLICVVIVGVFTHC